MTTGIIIAIAVVAIIVIAIVIVKKHKK